MCFRYTIVWNNTLVSVRDFWWMGHFDLYEQAWPIRQQDTIFLLGWTRHMIQGTIQVPHYQAVSLCLTAAFVVFERVFSDWTLLQLRYYMRERSRVYPRVTSSSPAIVWTLLDKPVFDAHEWSVIKGFNTCSVRWFICDHEMPPNKFIT